MGHSRVGSLQSCDKCCFSGAAVFATCSTKVAPIPVILISPTVSLGVLQSRKSPLLAWQAPRKQQGKCCRWLRCLLMWRTWQHPTGSGLQWRWWPFSHNKGSLRLLMTRVSALSPLFYNYYWIPCLEFNSTTTNNQNLAWNTLCWSGQSSDFCVSALVLLTFKQLW